jgi:NAD(P)-dependent dehydrogenase (short-subunit alcohol dehydrogenase family)
MSQSLVDEITAQTPIQSRYNFKSTAHQVIAKHNLQGKVAIVTGGYSGIGLESTRVLAKAGARVIVPVRNIEKAQSALRGIPNVEMDVMNLMEPSSIDAFATRFIASGRPLHILINSAGIMATPLKRDSRGNESQFSTNHLGHFQLTARLFPALQEAHGARVVSVSSRAQRMGGVNFEDPNFERTEYDRWKAYAQSKSANVLFAVELDRLARASSVRAFAVHPGLIPSTDLGSGSLDENASNLNRTFARIVPKLIRGLHVTPLLNAMRNPQHVADRYKTIQQGAATSIWCAVSDELDGMGGVYCEDCNIAVSVPANSTEPFGVRPWAIDPGYAKRLWKLSEKLTGVRFRFSNDNE